MSLNLHAINEIHVLYCESVHISQRAAVVHVPLQWVFYSLNKL